jgi:hypothetical protein
VSGYFDGSARFGIWPAEITLNSYSDTKDVFIAKYTSGGNIVWAKQAGGDDPIGDYCYQLFTVSDGSFFLTGYFSGTATFGEGGSTITKNTFGEYDVFFAKYNSNGSPAWVKQAGGSGRDYGRSMVMASDGSLYVGGHFQSGDFVIGPGEPNEVSMSTIGQSQIYIAKLASSGNLVWAREAGYQGFDGLSALECDLSVGVVICGSFLGDAYFGLGEANETYMISGSDSNAYLTKFHP